VLMAEEAQIRWLGVQHAGAVEAAGRGFGYIFCDLRLAWVGLGDAGEGIVCSGFCYRVSEHLSAWAAVEVFRNEASSP
jgi:hypothetical protein